MVSNTIHATYTETYDLNTILNELNILGIHTPQADALKFMFKGFFEQYKKYKILGCNFRMVCASQQSLDPTLIGTGDGQIAARDVLNPILFKACTGEHLNALLDQIYNQNEEQNMGTYGASVSQHLDSGTRALNAYYSMLADDSFRREHPQKGITVMGLKPMVHKVVTTQPFKYTGSTTPLQNDRPFISHNADGTGTPNDFGGSAAALRTLRILSILPSLSPTV